MKNQNNHEFTSPPATSDISTEMLGSHAEILAILATGDHPRYVQIASEFASGERLSCSSLSSSPGKVSENFPDHDSIVGTLIPLHLAESIQSAQIVKKGGSFSDIRHVPDSSILAISDIGVSVVLAFSGSVLNEELEILSADHSVINLYGKYHPPARFAIPFFVR